MEAGSEQERQTIPRRVSNGGRWGDARGGSGMAGGSKGGGTRLTGGHKTYKTTPIRAATVMDRSRAEEPVEWGETGRLCV